MVLKIDVINYTDQSFDLDIAYNVGFSLDSDSIISTYQDTPNTIWIMSILGLGIYDIRNNLYNEIKTIDNNFLGRVNDKIFRSPDGKIYFSIYGENSFGFVDEKNFTAHFIPSSNDNSLKGSKLLGMQIIDEKEIWILTNFGLESFNFVSRKFSVIRKNDTDQYIFQLFF